MYYLHRLPFLRNEIYVTHGSRSRNTGDELVFTQLVRAFYRLTVELGGRIICSIALKSGFVDNGHEHFSGKILVLMLAKYFTCDGALAFDNGR